jgi:hypothetical protein
MGHTKRIAIFSIIVILQWCLSAPSTAQSSAEKSNVTVAQENSTRGTPNAAGKELPECSCAQKSKKAVPNSHYVDYTFACQVLTGKSCVIDLKVLDSDSEATKLAGEECRKDGCVDESVRDVQPGAVIFDTGCCLLRCPSRNVCIDGSQDGACGMLGIARGCKPVLAPNRNCRNVAGC